MGVVYVIAGVATLVGQAFCKATQLELPRPEVFYYFSQGALLAIYLPVAVARIHNLSPLRLTVFVVLTTSSVVTLGVSIFKSTQFPVLFPGRTRQVVAVDLSGSMNALELEAAWTSIRAELQTLDVLIGFSDTTRFYELYQFDSLVDDQLLPVGGSTRIEVVLRFVREQEPNSKLIVVSDFAFGSPGNDWTPPKIREVMVCPVGVDSLALVQRFVTQWISCERLSWYLAN